MSVGLFDLFQACKRYGIDHQEVAVADRLCKNEGRALIIAGILGKPSDTLEGNPLSKMSVDFQETLGISSELSIAIT